MKDEEMAEEYRKDLKSKFLLSEPQLDLACQGFKDGYNKANEWHYPSKGEYPKEDTAEKETLYLLWFGLDDSDYMTGIFSHGGFWCFDSGWYETNEVIAWKEIVLPELPKESE